MRSAVRVYVIVLNWNKYRETKACLESIQLSNYSNLNIIVVDNGSRDGSTERLRTEFSNISFIFNDENLGFAGGVNIGIREALRDKNCRYVLLLNNDAILCPEFIGQAVVKAESDPDIAVVGGKMYQGKGSTRLSYAGGHVSRWRGDIVARGLGHEDNGQYDEPCETGFVIGALMFIRRNALESVGLLPEDYFFGTEDMDYCLALGKTGYKLYYLPTTAAYHLGGGSHFAWEPKWSYNAYRNKLILLQKHLPSGLFPIYKLLLRFYLRYLGPRRWQGIAIEHRFESKYQYSFSDMQRAMLMAIDDHAKVPLTENRLLEIERVFDSRRAGSAHHNTAKSASQ